MTRRSESKASGASTSVSKELSSPRVKVELVSELEEKTDETTNSQDLAFEESMPDFGGDYTKLLGYHKQRIESETIEKANLKRRIIELECQLKKVQAEKEARQSAGKPLKLSKREKQLAAKDVLKKYFSEAQINYLIDFKSGKSTGGEGEGEEAKAAMVTNSSRKGCQNEKPSVRWSASDLNKFAKLKAHIRIVGYNYIRRMNIVPMPSLNILQRAHREGKLSPDTVELMEQKMRARMTNGSTVPKTGSVGVYLKGGEGGGEVTDSGSSGKPAKKKAKINHLTPGAVPPVTIKEPTPSELESKRQLDLVMAAIQANNLPSIIIRKKHHNPADNSLVYEERALFTPHHGQRTGDWNDQEFDTILQKRSVTGYNRKQTINTQAMELGRANARRAKAAKLLNEQENEDNTAAVITYDEERNTYTLKKEDSGQITIIEQQAAINSIGGGGADGTHVQVQTVPLGAAQVHQVQGTTTGGEVTLGGHGVVGGGGSKQQVLQIGTIGGNQLVLHPISSQDSNTVTLITNNTPNSFEFRPVQAGDLSADLVSTGEGAPHGTQVVYTTTEDGQMIQSHYQTVGYTTTAVETTEHVAPHEHEIPFHNV